MLIGLKWVKQVNVPSPTHRWSEVFQATMAFGKITWFHGKSTKLCHWS